MRARSLLGGLLLAALCACSGGALPREDGGAADAGRDAGPVDAGAADAGQPDAGPVDAGPPDAGCAPGTRFDAATAACVARCNPTGLLHDQPLQVGNELRHFMLYVPAAYACDGGAMPLLVDFHGTWSGAESDQGEEYYALDGLIGAADDAGFIAARPRSRFSAEGGTNVYRWDQNPGDYARNVAMAHALVTHLQALYDIDPDRTYASGFSSGTGMIAQFFADQPQTFHGYAFVGGGYWESEPPAAVHLGTPAPRLYAVSGYRDYLFPEQQRLVDLLDSTGYPAGQLFRRGSDNGHELYGWHFNELWAWMDRGVRPAPGSVDGGWVSEATGSTVDLIALTGTPDAGTIAVGNTGRISVRDGSGTWTEAGPFVGTGGAPALTAVCLLPSGEGFTVGEGQTAHTLDFGRSWSAAAIPSFNPSFFDPPRHSAIACSGSEVVAAGSWDAAHRSDGGSWQATTTTSSFGPFQSQVAAVKVSPEGTWLASGYYAYLGRSVDGVTFNPVAPAVQVQWLMGIAPAAGGHWWVVGEAGTVMASSDDGLTWSAQASGTAEDLYAVSFFDAQRGLAVGAHGAAIVTTNGGSTWSDLSTGVDDYLSDATWLDAHTVLVVGGKGRALRHAVP